MAEGGWYLQVCGVVVVAGDALLQLADLEKVLGTHTPAEFRDEGDVLAHVARQLAEFGVLLDEALHVGYGFDVGVVLGLGLVLLDVLLDVAAQVAKVHVHVLLEEGVLVLREHNLLELWPDVGHAAQVHTTVVNAEEVVDHGLVCPLGEQRRDGVLSPVEDQQDGRRVDFAEVEQLVFLGDAVPDLGRELLGQQACLLVPDQGFLLERQEGGDDAFCCPLQGVCIPGVLVAAPYPVQGRAHVEGEEVWVDDDVVEKVFLHHFDDLVVVGFGQAFQGRLFDNVAKVEMVLPVLWFPELVDEKAYRVGMWPHEAETAEMAHLFTLGVVQAVDEVDLVVEEGGLSDGRRDAGHRLAVQQEDFHLC